MENTNVLFDRKRLVRLIVPLIVEQVLAVTVGMADMVMVSGAGETAVSGISLVNTICVLLIVIFTSMASGGSVVGSQFLGSGDKKTACHAAEQLVMICGLIALVICGISFSETAGFSVWSTDRWKSRLWPTRWNTSSLHRFRFRFLASTMRGRRFSGLWETQTFQWLLPS